ncbi:MFS transporter [Sphingomonas sabuli]|uniref:MFS transporter n=1 Tax=Sphingomonas sabuli TaxID=2764186 RepID=A0A7G9KZB1_9SPHN|nr:MFS transporter [Sphingomonas sabuli]QNM81710.1 MFS transporter [Sphingomonas sabuli]
MTDRAIGPRYIAASFGAHCAFLPLLTFVVPVRVEALSDEPVYLLSLLLIIGALTASIANIAAGYASDTLMARRGSRRGMATVGLAATAAALVAFAFAQSFAQLVAALIVFQLAFNAMFAPLIAVLADHVPDNRKGVTAAWLNFALPAGTVATAAAAAAAPLLGDLLMPAIAATVSALILPFLFAWPAPLQPATAAAEEEPMAQPPLRRDFLFAWIARLCIQFGAVIVLSYLYLYIGEFGAGAAAARPMLAKLSLYASPFALAACLYLARRSDLVGKRKAILTVTSLAIAAALLLLVLAKVWIAALAGYTIFLAGLTVFLALDSALVAELLRGTDKRGGALGWMNLTNTLPSIAAPTLTIGLSVTAPDPDIIRLALMVAGALALVSAVCVSRIASVR